MLTLDCARVAAHKLLPHTYPAHRPISLVEQVFFLLG